jgi:hypothetical protein
MEFDNDQQRVSASGLFWFRSDLPLAEKIEIIDWYDGLSPQARRFVDRLRQEARDDTAFFAQGD